MDSQPFIAMADMSRTPFAIAILLVLGVLVLRQFRPTKSHSGIWLPIAAFVAGPLIAIGYFVVDIFIVSRDYETTDDYVQSVIRILIIGFVGGAIGSVGLWVGDRFRFRRSTQGPRQD